MLVLVAVAAAAPPPLAAGQWHVVASIEQQGLLPLCAWSRRWQRSAWDAAAARPRDHDGGLAGRAAREGGEVAGAR